jgi:hypothetical protein
MIVTLADAWQWYMNAQTLTSALQRLGGIHWDSLPWEGALGRDNRLRDLEKNTVVTGAQIILDDLDDLCVLLLFSVFEALVREQVLKQVKEELPEPQHVHLRHAVESMRESLEFGNFFRVLEPFKALDADLVEHVNQVRQYRNWVAHGRRGPPPVVIDPRMAYERLQRFLDRFLP